MEVVPGTGVRSRGDGSGGLLLSPREPAVSQRGGEARRSRYGGWLCGVMEIRAMPRKAVPLLSST